MREIREKLSAIASGEQVAHAYLFTGERAEEKKSLALFFAKALQCSGQGQRPCGVCSSCRKASRGNHPDILFVSHEKPNSIGVDDVRGQLVNDVAILPYEGARKVYIIDEAEKLTVQAQNAILKTIEEPPSYAVILLLAAGAENLLPTVVSRCVRIELAETQEQEDPEVSGNGLYLAKRSREMDVVTMVETIKRMSEEKENIRAYLEVFRRWFRDVLLFKATCEAEGLCFSDELPAIRERASVSGYEQLEAILRAIDTAEMRLNANVNFEITMELLFLTMREN